MKHKLYKGDCLEVMKHIEDKSVNLVIYDAPYFSTGIKEVGDKQWKNEEEYINWCVDVIKETQRVLKDNGSFYWFHNDINIMVDLLYRIKRETKFKLKNQITWSKFNNWKNANIKDGAGMYRSVLQCYGNQRTYNASTTEYIYYFTFDDETGLKRVMLDTNNFKELRNYFSYIQDMLKMTKKEILNKVGQRADHCFRHSSSQWDLPTEDTYNALIENFGINKFDKFRTYEDLKKEYCKLRSSYENVRLEYEKKRYSFNQPKENFKGIGIDKTKEILKPYTSVWEYDRDKTYFEYAHLTPKPVKMIEHIIKVSSNEGDVIMDCFMGSNSTGIACLNTNRNYIGIEKNDAYFDICIDRAKKHIEDNNINCELIANK